MDKVRRLAGHSKLTTTQRYTHTNKDLTEAVNAVAKVIQIDKFRAAK